MLPKIIEIMRKAILKKIFPTVDEIFRGVDKKNIRRTKNIRLIPDLKHRRGGKVSYAEWAHVIGIFQTIIYQTLFQKTGNGILDIGCGTGLLGIASEPFTMDGGFYTGIDVMEEDILFCQEQFQLPNYKFIHFDVANPFYAAEQNDKLRSWPIAGNSKDLVTALSVWTHMSERDAIFYFSEIYRVLRKGGKALITFFYLDEQYEKSLPLRQKEKGRFHSTCQSRWVFDTPAYESAHWYTPHWTEKPEAAIGIQPEGLDYLLKKSGLRLLEYYPGNWKEIPGIFFQDILIFEK